MPRISTNTTDMEETRKISPKKSSRRNLEVECQLFFETLLKNSSFVDRIGPMFLCFLKESSSHLKQAMRALPYPKN